MRGVLIAVFELLAVILATAVWVYLDARAHAGRGRPIVSSMGSVRLSTPVAWFFACLMMWEMYFPLYLDSRSIA